MSATTLANNGSGLVQAAAPTGLADSLFSKPRQPDIWYREPWLLLVIGGPALVVLACVVTMYLAITRPDPLVSKDYYRDGLRINQTMAAEEAARSLVSLKAKQDAANPANQGSHK